jgi:dihydroxyacetone kinase-like predicted kinase
MSSKIGELNTINVFPIADGDTGANMKVCLKLPTRNLLLNPSDNILIAASNMAADVLLNGQGNSGTILSHFFVSLAEEVRDCKKASLTIDEFASCLQGAGVKMDQAVPNPVEGTLLSVCRDACKGLGSQAKYSSLGALLTDWNDIAQKELALTPDRLVVDGVKVLEKAGVVDSGAQGFVYLIEGMYLGQYVRNE